MKTAHAWVLTCMLYSLVCSRSFCSSTANDDAGCRLAATHSTTRSTFFHGRAGIALDTPLMFFEPRCDGVLANVTGAPAAFQHAFWPAVAQTKLLLQVSVVNPDTAALRFSIDGISVTLGAHGVRTHSHIRVAGSQGVTTPGSMKRRQIQQLEITIRKRGTLCVLEMAAYAEVQRVFVCTSTSLFYVHGNNVTLHSVSLRPDNVQVALWNFAVEAESADAKCRQCPRGTHARNTNNVAASTVECVPCWTGLHVNVDAHSAWWHNAIHTVAVEPTVPAPDWAVLLVNGEAASTGILRHSKMHTNGNMILTNAAEKYTYDRVASICSSRYKTRLIFAACAPTQSPKMRIYPGNNVVLLPVVSTQGTPANVRSVLASAHWRLGDTVRFCVSPMDTRSQHSCMNPIVLTWRAANSWSPVNIDAVHSQYTRYHITTSNTNVFTLA